MSYEITFRFAFRELDKREVDQAVQSTLRDYAGAAVEPNEGTAPQDPAELDYTLSLSAELVQRHRDDFDDPLPPSENGIYHGSFTFHADEEPGAADRLGYASAGAADPLGYASAGAALVLDGDRNGHVWGLMSEIVASIAEKLGGRLEQDEEEDAGEAQDDGELLEDEPLTTWEALERYAREAYPLDGEGEGWFATTVTWTDTPRTHQVRVTHFEREEGEPWVVLRSAVCKEDQLRPEDALRRNDELPVAMLALSGDVYELVYSFPLEALTAGRFALLLDQIAADADDLEEMFSGGDEF
jgi:hypothetical protein